MSIGTILNEEQYARERSTNLRPHADNNLFIRFKGVFGSYDNKPWVSPVPLDKASEAKLIEVYGADRTAWTGKQVVIRDTKANDVFNIRPAKRRGK